MGVWITDICVVMVKVDILRGTPVQPVYSLLDQPAVSVFSFYRCSRDPGCRQTPPRPLCHQYPSSECLRVSNYASLLNLVKQNIYTENSLYTVILPDGRSPTTACTATLTRASKLAEMLHIKRTCYIFPLRYLLIFYKNKIFKYNYLHKISLHRTLKFAP